MGAASGRAGSDLYRICGRRLDTRAGGGYQGAACSVGSCSAQGKNIGVKRPERFKRNGQKHDVSREDNQSPPGFFYFLMQYDTKYDTKQKEP